MWKSHATWHGFSTSRNIHVCQVVLRYSKSTSVYLFVTVLVLVANILSLVSHTQGFIYSWSVTYPSMFTTVELPCKPPLIRPHFYYDHSFVAWIKARTFSYMKTSLIWPPCYCNQWPPLRVPSCYFLSKMTLLIQLRLVNETFSFTA